MLNISLQSEYVANIVGLNITNTFLTSILVTIILLVASVIFYFHKKGHKNIILKGIEILIYELLQLCDKITNNRKLSKKILPLIATFFLFIVTANIIALIPGFLDAIFVKKSATKMASLVRSPNSDLTTTIALSIFSVLAIQFFSLQALGLKGFLARFFNFHGIMNFILGIFEIISESVKILSFSFRLFGNLFAGEVLLLVVSYLVPYILPLPFMFLEIFVGIIQAFIFAALTLTFIKTSTLHHLANE